MTAENEILAMLNGEITKTLEEISQVKTGSEEAKAALAKLEKLHSQRMKETEAILKHEELKDRDFAQMDERAIKWKETENRQKQLESELAIREKELAEKEEELKETKRGRRWRTALDFIGIAVPTAATGFWMYQGMKFEEEGKIFSSRTMQWLSNHMRLFGKKG